MHEWWQNVGVCVGRVVNARRGLSGRRRRKAQNTVEERETTAEERGKAANGPERPRATCASVMPARRPGRGRDTRLVDTGVGVCAGVWGGRGEVQRGGSRTGRRGEKGKGFLRKGEAGGERERESGKEGVEEELSRTLTLTQTHLHVLLKEQEGIQKQGEQCAITLPKETAQERLSLRHTHTQKYACVCVEEGMRCAR